MAMARIHFLLLLAIFLDAICCNSFAVNITSSLPKFKTILFFGDSILDTGNNNYIKTVMKSYYRPYGQDFNDGIPTGRFSNGKLIPDMLASALGIKQTVPPSLDPSLSNHDLITGVNFASAGSGYDNATVLFTNVIPITKQIDMFKEYITRLKGIVGEDRAMQIINGALVVVTGGTNDFVLNMYDIPTRRVKFTATQYIDFLQDKVEIFIKELYVAGVKSILIAGIPPIGSLPLQSSIRLVDPFTPKYSLEEQNTYSMDYNHKLISVLARLQQTLPNTKIVYNDLYFPVVDMITNPKRYGFVETKNGCCGSSALKQSFLCDPVTPPCKQPSSFLFWDRIHPTSTAYQHIINSILLNTLPKFLP